VSPFRAGFAAIVGRPNVGKSTLLNRLLGHKLAIVSDKPQTTRNRILAVLNRPGGQIVLLDTPGIHKPMHRMNERMVQTAMASLSHVDLAVLVIDASEPAGKGDVFVVEALKRRRLPTLVALNKIDRVEKPRLLPAIDRLRGLHDFREIVPLSALTGDNVELLAERVLAHLPEGERLYPEEFLTDLPERFFVAEMIREQILQRTRQELPYATGVVIEAFREEGELVRIQAAILVERDSQKAIVIGKGGAMLKAIGSAARREIEAFLGSRVFLGLFVKVRADWREDPRALDTLGVGLEAGREAKGPGVER
jgi:GTP-binding protein Era